MCEISDPAGRYAEHRTMKGEEIYFYQGIDFIRDVEVECRAGAGRVLRLPATSSSAPVSGQMANEVVFKGVVKFVNRGPGRGPGLAPHPPVMNNDLTKGGHLSVPADGRALQLRRGGPGDRQGAGRQLPVRKDNPYKIDIERLGDGSSRRTGPSSIVFGKSMFIYREPVAFVARHRQGLGSAPGHHVRHGPRARASTAPSRSRFAEGADIVTGSTHKTFFGPQRGVIAGNLAKELPLAKLWLEIKSRAFPGSTSNHHLGTLLGLLMATYEMNAFKAEYQDQVRAQRQGLGRGPARRRASTSRATRPTATPRPTRC